MRMLRICVCTLLALFESLCRLAFSHVGKLSSQLQSTSHVTTERLSAECLAVLMTMEEEASRGCVPDHKHRSMWGTSGAENAAVPSSPRLSRILFGLRSYTAHC